MNGIRGRVDDIAHPHAGRISLVDAVDIEVGKGCVRVDDLRRGGGQHYTFDVGETHFAKASLRTMTDFCVLEVDQLDQQVAKICGDVRANQMNLGISKRKVCGGRSPGQPIDING